jgi:hypothetical protein
VLALATLPKPRNPNEANANAIVSVFFISSSLVRKILRSYSCNPDASRSETMETEGLANKMNHPRNSAETFARWVLHSFSQDDDWVAGRSSVLHEMANSMDEDVK